MSGRSKANVGMAELDNEASDTASGASWIWWCLEPNIRSCRLTRGKVDRS